MMEKDGKIFVAGHRGMVGSAVVRMLTAHGYANIITRSRTELDLRDRTAVTAFFRDFKPDYVVLSAARVGGIEDNRRHCAEFLIENLEIQNNVIYQAYAAGVKKLCFLGSSCIYPRECPQPIREDYLLTGPLEPTNEGYAIAKIAGYKLGYYLYKQYGFNVISLMPCNLYGTNDHFDLEKAHVLSSLVRRFTDAVDDGAASVTLWGTGIARREFLHVDDLAEATVMMMNTWNEPEFVNIGSGVDITIRELAETIASLSGFKGAIMWDASKPDGMLRKCMDVGKMKSIGFNPGISLEEGIKRTIAEYRELKRAGKIVR